MDVQFGLALKLGRTTLNATGRPRIIARGQNMQFQGNILQNSMAQ